jgi:hypothetical protein
MVWFFEVAVGEGASVFYFEGAGVVLRGVSLVLSLVEHILLRSLRSTVGVIYAE